MSIRKVLIANRGEIAVRIMQTANARGIATVAVYSDADANAYHVRAADEAVHIGGPAPSESYLNIRAIIDAAKASGADAIHPGYGFLSERADFAAACAEAGLIFIGPPAAAIVAMGDKANAKRLMKKAGVPCISGYEGEDQSGAVLAMEADRIGFPVMIKASAGGGGRGMRIVQDKDGLPATIVSARKEAQSAFGDGRLLMERALTGARHVEMQVFADGHGNIVHLGERDCSLQRRNQKVIEEAPSPVINEAMRVDMGAAAVKAAEAVGYQGAGTVEFLYDPARDEFYFLEMNTRLQVEHAVTEGITGLDLVDMQFDVAEGAPLAVAQDDVEITGCAIEARIYAENPSENFLPQTGAIVALELPIDPDIRIDAGVEAGDEVGAFYDPMIAKVIANGATRDEARRKLIAALSETVLFGVGTNIEFLIGLLEDDTFAKGEADTGHIEHNISALAGAAPEPQVLDITLAAAVSFFGGHGPLLSGFDSRGSQFFPFKLRWRDNVIDASAKIGGQTITGQFSEKKVTLKTISHDGLFVDYIVNDKHARAGLLRDGVNIYVKRGPVAFVFEDITYAPAYGAAGTGDAVIAPMAGLVTGVVVKPGSTVVKGEVLATIEAMKMEHQLKAPRDGVVADVLAKAGDQVAIRAKLVVLEAET